MTSENNHFEIPCASIQFVERKKAGVVSSGDCAMVRLAPGIIPFLETRILGTGISLGAGYQSRFTVPFGLAATAAYAVIAPMQTEAVTWTGFDVELRWERAADSGETLLATATITEFDPGLACFTISCRTQAGSALLSGRLRLRALRNGRTVGTSLLKATLLKETPRAGPEPRPRLAGYSLIASVEAPEQLMHGASGVISLEVINAESVSKTMRVSLAMPVGAGISLDSDADSIEVEVAPGSTTTVKATIRADRPHEVNLGKPWPVAISVKAGKKEEVYTVRVAVPDPRPRRIFYVLSEDCETFDGGPLTGNYGASALGNANNFMDPEDYRIQMIEKPNRMNQIAEKHGARFTHFWCAPQRFAVDWAATQSQTGEWPKLALELDESIRRGSVMHEYAPHIHFDYEPDSRHPPQPRLVYDAATDGILPNEYYDPISNPRHHYHDWDGSGRGIEYVKELGSLGEGDSKAGSLRKSLAYLARMQAGRRQPTVARAGGFDFGITAEDQTVSAAAHVANGLRASSDALFQGGSPPRSRLAYWCDSRDRMREVETLDAAQLVELAVTRDTDFSDVKSDNDWFASWAERAGESGVYLITALMHAMFLRGVPDAFRSLEGGSFAGLDEHLRWVRAEYPEVESATASDALLEFIDYYTPRMETAVSAVLCGGKPAEGLYEYGVRLLGAGIRVDEKRPAVVRVLAPAVFESGDVACLRVMADGEVLVEGSEFGAASRPALTVTLRNKLVDLRLQVQVKLTATERVSELFRDARYVDPVENPRQPLFQMRSSSPGYLSTDVLRLLVSPIAGFSEPLGRRIHPWGVFLIGGALTAALENVGRNASLEPAYLRLRWRKAVTAEGEVFAHGHEVNPHRCGIQLRDATGEVLADAEVELRTCAVKLRPAVREDEERLNHAALSRDLRDLRERHSQVLKGIQDYEVMFREVLSRYRRERAWRLMIVARKIYVAMARRDWKAALQVLRGGPAPATAHDELFFPNVSDFVETPPRFDK